MVPSDWVPLGVSGAGRVPSWRRRTNTLLPRMPQRRKMLPFPCDRTRLAGEAWPRSRRRLGAASLFTVRHAAVRRPFSRGDGAHIALLSGPARTQNYPPATNPENGHEAHRLSIVRPFRACRRGRIGRGRLGWAADAVGAARCLPFDPLKRTDRKAGPAAKAAEPVLGARRPP